MNIPLHAQRLADGTLGAYRLRVMLWRGPGHKAYRVDAGLGTNDERLATERACYMLKGMLHFGEFMGVVAVERKTYVITREQVEQWLADTGHVIRTVSPRTRRIREMRRRRREDNGTPPLPFENGGSI